VTDSDRVPIDVDLLGVPDGVFVADFRTDRLLETVCEDVMDADRDAPSVMDSVSELERVATLETE
jgi:hypothetical protein